MLWHVLHCTYHMELQLDLNMDSTEFATQFATEFATQFATEFDQKEAHARAMLQKMNETRRVWRWALRGIVISNE